MVDSIWGEVRLINEKVSMLKGKQENDILVVNGNLGAIDARLVALEEKMYQLEQKVAPPKKTTKKKPAGE